MAAVIHRPDLLILDEPFSGLDPVNQRLLRDLVEAEHARGATVLFSTHSGMRRKATFTLIVDDLVKSEKALEKIGADDVQDSSVIMVEMAHKVGALERISTIIANAGINIYYFYSTTSSGRTATCVIKTEDDKKTIKVLSQA